MDQRERSGDSVECLRAAIEGVLSGLQTAIPGIVQTVDLAAGTCTVQPAIQAYVRQSDGSQKWVQLPTLLNVPIVFMAAGAFLLTVPLSIGDEVLVIFASRCIDSWWQSGGIQVQAELRMHDWHDGFAIMGPRSLPNATPNISGTSAQLRSQDGTTYVEIALNGIVNIVAPGGLFVNGAIVATGEVTAKSAHTVSAHTHTDPQGGVTGGPTG